MTQATTRTPSDDAALPGAGPPPEPQPRSRLPDIPGPVDTARLAWRKLRRMSTALALLFALAAAAVVATFVPQEPVISATVEAWRSGTAGPGPTTAAVFDALGFFDVFGSWWFLGLTALLFVSLTGCLIPRFRAFAKVVRRPPAAGHNLDRLSAHRMLTTTLPPEQAVAAAERVLRRRRFRRRHLATADSPTGNLQLAAERGHWREGGSLLFHSAFYLLLIGILVGQARGFTGYVGLVEGQSFTDTRVSYENVAQVGRYWGVGDHRAFRGTLDDFEASFYPDGTAREYVASLTIADAAGDVQQERLRVNHPVRVDGMVLYQSTYGMAPRIVVAGADGGVPIFDKSVRLAPGEQPGWWTGTERITTGGEQAAGGDAPSLPQMAIDIAFLPDAREVEGPDGPVTVPGAPTVGDARLFATIYLGDLELERNEPMTAIRADWFDPESGALAPGVTTETIALDEGADTDVLGGTLTASFPDLSLWSGIQVSHQPGRFVLLTAGLLLLAGLIPSLYAYRRRIWVDVRPAADGNDSGSEVVLAGVALQRPMVFTDEFDAISEQLTAVLPPQPDPTTAPPQSHPTTAPPGAT